MLAMDLYALRLFVISLLSNSSVKDGRAYASKP